MVIGGAAVHGTLIYPYVPGRTYDPPCGYPLGDYLPTWNPSCYISPRIIKQFRPAPISIEIVQQKHPFLHTPILSDFAPFPRPLFTSLKKSSSKNRQILHISENEPTKSTVSDHRAKGSKFNVELLNIEWSLPASSFSALFSPFPPIFGAI